MVRVCDLDSSLVHDGVFAGSSCAFGVFDGFHVGHRYLVERAIAEAREDNHQSIILTFDSDPDELFRADSLKKIMSNESRIEALKSSGADFVVVIPFDEHVRSLLPNEFLDTLFDTDVPCSLYVGEDFSFGRYASGNVEDLRTWGSQHGMRICPLALYEKEGSPVTATRIRDLLSQGLVEEASLLLGGPYVLEGVVEQGRQEGRNMGFRTANLSIPKQMMALDTGVYAAYTTLFGKKYKVALSYGVSPTFSDARAQCEAHILDFDGDIYGERISLKFVSRLRPMIRFENVDALIDQVMSDITWCRENL